jgi:hypothetical protein
MAIFKAAIENTTVTSNQLAGMTISSGGPMLPFDSLVLKNVTVSKNAVGSGGVSNLYFKGPTPFAVPIVVSVSNSIISQGAGLPHPNCVADSGMLFDLRADHTLIDDDSCSATGVGNLKADPLLAPLSFNGGFTQTMLPNLSSPVINSGDDSTCLPADQRGFSRVGGCDMGSVEVQ